MRAGHIWLAFFIFGALATPVLARTGVAIAPASGSYELGMDGGSIDLTVYNTGDEAADYTLAAGGPGLLVKVEPVGAEIPGGSYVTFSVVIDPTADIKPGESYTLTATAKNAAGGNILVGAQSSLELRFTGTRTRPWAESPEPASELMSTKPVERAEEPSGATMAAVVGPEPSGIGVLPLILMAIAATGVGYGLYRKLR